MILNEYNDNTIFKIIHKHWLNITKTQFLERFFKHDILEENMFKYNILLWHLFGLNLIFFQPSNKKKQKHL
jgi:hypothetical protein